MAFTNVLWYLEFLAFAVILILFFLFFLYLARLNYVRYNPRYDMRVKKVILPLGRRPAQTQKLRQRPFCFDQDCVLFCRIIGSITVIAVCYYLAYSLISDTKLKFGMFVA